MPGVSFSVRTVYRPHFKPPRSRFAVFATADAAGDLLPVGPYKQPGLRVSITRSQFDPRLNRLLRSSQMGGITQSCRAGEQLETFRLQPAQQREDKTILAPFTNRFHEDIFRFAATVAQRATETDGNADISLGIWEDFHSSGLGLSPLPSELGGAGLCLPSQGERLSEILRALGAADLSIARLYEGHLNAVGLVCRYGSQQRVETFAADVRAGALSGVWGADDAEGLTIVSTASGNILKGRKILASGAGFVTRPLVTAKGPLGHQMCLLELEPGYAFDIQDWQAQGMRVVERCGLNIMEKVQKGIGLRAFVRPHDVERICRDLATYLRQPVPDLAMSDGARAFLNSALPVGDFR